MTSMRKCIAAAGIAMVLGGGARADEGQWIFRETFPNGEDGPIAVYLSSDYAWVVARVTCARATHELVLDYIDIERSGGSTEAIALIGTRSLDLATSFDQGWMTGRIAVDANLLRLLDESQELSLWQPDGENEWHLGRAEALRKVVQKCR
jgi:hypothetical protein